MSERREAKEDEKLRSVEADRVFGGGCCARHFNSDLSAKHLNCCHLLCFGSGNGVYYRKNLLKGGVGMQVVVVEAPRFLRGILKKVFKIRKED